MYHLHRRLSYVEGNPRSKGIIIALFTLLLAIVYANPAHAQYRASIQGTVTDPEGASIASADLTLVDLGTNLTLTTKSDAAGVYHFNALPPNRFKLTVTASGFQSKTLENLQIIPEQVNAVNVQMVVGTINTAITVESNSLPALDTATASINGTVSENQIQHMPAIGRDVTQLTQLALGVFGDGGQSSGGGTRTLPGSNTGGATATSGIFATENAPQIVANGGQNNSNGIEIDGISTVSAVWGGATVITPSADSVDNVKVTSNSYDAEFGRFSGAQTQITSKSGTNRLHGSLFFKAERPGLNAYQRWNGPSSTVAGTLPSEASSGTHPASISLAEASAVPSGRTNFSRSSPMRHCVITLTTFANGWYETPQFLASARQGSIARTYAQYPGEGVNAAAQFE